MPPDIEFTGASIPPDVMERTATDRRLPLAGLAGPGITATARTADRSPQQG